MNVCQQKYCLHTCDAGGTTHGDHMTRRRSRIFSNSTVLVLLVMVMSAIDGLAQNLVNSGSIRNNGRIKVQGQAVGLPSVIDGVVEYYGGSQNIPAAQYEHLALTGSGTKSTVGGSFIVSQNVTIAPPVTLQVQAGQLVTLGGTLTEDGYLAGSIRKSADLSGGTTTSSFGNIGVTVSWTGVAPGVTTATRTSLYGPGTAGTQGILRYYDLAAPADSMVNGTLVFKYSDNELNGRDPRILELWRSPDGGVSWRRQGGTVDTVQRTITKVGIAGLGRWTASDVLLGPPEYEGAVSNIASTSGNNQIDSVTSYLAPFVLAATDYYGNRIPGVVLTFAIDSIPSAASGQSLSATSDTTDVYGQASTMLRLGTKIGTYVVTARAPSLPNFTAMLNARARAGAAAALAVVSGNAQSSPAGTILSQPFVVAVSDRFGNPAQGARVDFAITGVPQGATGQQLSVYSAVADSLGHAQTVMGLGNFPGTYTVTASVQGVAPAQLSASATVVFGDVNSDLDINIADLTSVIDHILAKNTFIDLDSIKADVTRDGAINVLDVQAIKNYLLGSGSLSKPAGERLVGQLNQIVRPLGTSLVSSLANLNGELEFTSRGTLLNLTNTTPIKGVQLFVRLKTTAQVESTDVVFNRANMMQVSVKSQSNDIRAVAYNSANTPMDSGSGSVFRLPFILNDTSLVDSVHMIVSVEDTTVDLAVNVPVTVKLTKDIYPKDFTLSQNYPNPFNPVTYIEYALPVATHITLEVFNTLGQRVTTLVNEVQNPGRYRIPFDGKGYASGAYFYSLKANDFFDVRKMIYLK